jgi:hypothetical protein
VLFQGQAAAELVAQVLASRLLAIRPPVVDEPRFESMVSGLENPFVDRLGARVLPEFLSVSDNPLLTTSAGFPRVGGYQVDDEGAGEGDRPDRRRLLEDPALDTDGRTHHPPEFGQPPGRRASAHQPGRDGEGAGGGNCGKSC